MNDETKLLILEPASRAETGRLGEGIERQRIINAVTAAGAKVRHDSGGRLLVIETSAEADQRLQRELPGVTVVSVDENLSERVADLDTSDSLFARALEIRNSQEYRDIKSRLKPGETPEEQLLFTAPCTPED